MQCAAWSCLFSVQLLSMRCSSTDTGPAEDIFSWQSRVEDGNLPLHWGNCWWKMNLLFFLQCNCRAVSLGKRCSGPCSRDKQWQDKPQVLHTCTAALTVTTSFLHSVHWCSRKWLLPREKLQNVFADPKARCQEICWARWQVYPMAGYPKTSGCCDKKTYLGAGDTETAA